MAGQHHSQSSTRVAVLDRIDNVLRSRKIKALMGRLGLITDTKNTWRWVTVPEHAEGIPIWSIVSPLRYDVLVRRDFYSFYAAHRDLYLEDRNGFADLARKDQLLYLVLGVRGRTRQQSPAYEQNLAGFQVFAANEPSSPAVRERQTVRVPDSVSDHPQDGKPDPSPYDESRGASSGKRLGAKYFLADGCHRVALLMALGHQNLPAEYFRVKHYQEFSPFDSTVLLARRVVQDASEYYCFLSQSLYGSCYVDQSA